MGTNSCTRWIMHTVRHGQEEIMLMSLVFVEMGSFFQESASEKDASLKGHAGKRRAIVADEFSLSL